MAETAAAGRREGIAGGFLMLAIGAGSAVQGRTYGVGTLTRMGPGFLPVALGAVLAGLGLLLVVSSLRPARPAPSLGIAEAAADGIDWRGVACIAAGLAAFIGLGAAFGLVPASFACVFIAALGDRTATLRSAAVLAACMTVAGTLLFSYGLGIRFPLLHWG